MMQPNLLAAFLYAQPAEHEVCGIQTHPRSILMDDRGNLYFEPAPELVAKKKLTAVKRLLTLDEVRAGKIGRNAPCGCGSGRKFKKCCYGKPWTELKP